jgi:hypothetical protein
VRIPVVSHEVAKAMATLIAHGQGLERLGAFANLHRVQEGLVIKDAYRPLFVQHIADIPHESLRTKVGVAD